MAAITDLAILLFHAGLLVGVLTLTNISLSQLAQRLKENKKIILLFIGAVLIMEIGFYLFIVPSAEPSELTVTPLMLVLPITLTLTFAGTAFFRHRLLETINGTKVIAISMVFFYGVLATDAFSILNQSNIGNISFPLAAIAFLLLIITLIKTKNTLVESVVYLWFLILSLIIAGVSAIAAMLNPTLVSFVLIGFLLPFIILFMFNIVLFTPFPLSRETVSQASRRFWQTSRAFSKSYDRGSFNKGTVYLFALIVALAALNYVALIPSAVFLAVSFGAINYCKKL